MKTPVYNPIFSLKFMRALIIHMRPYLLFVSGVAGLAGIAIAWQSGLSVLQGILVFLAFFLAYGFGQALTDCFQIDTDSISASYRPLVKKEVSPKAIGTVSVLGLVSLGIPVIYYNSANLIFCVLSVFGLATYTYFKKNFWFAGPFYNGWIVMLLPIMGYLAISQQKIGALLNLEMVLVCIITLFSYANFVLIGYLKDISADRQTGYQTFPVVFGWDKTVWLANFFLIIVLIAGFNLIDKGNLLAFGTFSLASIVAIAGQVKALTSKNKTEANSKFPILATVRAFILWHIAIVLNYQESWIFLVLIYYCLFEVVMLFRPEKNQI